MCRCAPKTNGVSDGANPEQLFAAAWTGCFCSALNYASRMSGIESPAATVTVEIAQGPDSDGAYGLAAKITAFLPGVDQFKIQELAGLAHQGCPYFKATRGNMAVGVTAM